MMNELLDMMDATLDLNVVDLDQHLGADVDIETLRKTVEHLKETAEVEA